MQKRQLILATLLMFLSALMILLPGVSAVQAIEKVTPQAPEGTLTVEEYLAQGMDAIGRGDYSSAVLEFSNAIELDPENADFYFLRAFAYQELNRIDQAIDDYTSALEIRSYDSSFYTARGDAYTEEGNLELAIEDYTQAIFYNPRLRDAYEGRAAAHYELGENTAGEIDEKVAEGLSRAQFNDSESAIELYTDAIESADGEDLPELVGAYYNRGFAYHAVGDVEAALEDYTAGLEIAPHMQDIYMARGFTYANMGEVLKAGRNFIRRMELIKREDFDEGTIGFGDPSEIEMAYGTVYRFNFRGEAGDLVTITAKAFGGDPVDPLLVLLGPDGTAIAGDDDGDGNTNALLEDFELPETGSYTIVISHANGGFEGLVEVELQ